MNKRWRFGDYYSLCRAQRRWIWLPIAAKAPSLSHSMGKTTCCNSQNKPIRSHKTTDSHPFGTQKRLDTSMEWCFIIVISLQSNPFTQTQTPIPITKHVHKQPLKKKREKKNGELRREGPENNDGVAGNDLFSLLHRHLPSKLWKP